MDGRNTGFMERLFSADGPSGDEHEVIDIISEYLSPLMETRHDRLGSLRAAIPGAAGSPTVLLAAHADEIGMSVKYIDDEGFIWFSHIGGVDPKTLPGVQVRIHAESGIVPGVIGVKPTHLVRGAESEKVPGSTEVYIDIGAAGKTDAEAIVAIGDTISFRSACTRLLNGRLTSHGLDDKVGCYIQAEVLRRLAEEKVTLPVNVIGVFTSQEEVGLRGATTAAFASEAAIGICIEVEFATDHPGMDKRLYGDLRMGHGPILPRGVNVHPVLFRHFRNTARQAGIPCQVGDLQYPGGTDAGAMQVTRDGMATVLVMVPLRYMHSPAEVVATDDMENAILLLLAALKNIGQMPQFEEITASYITRKSTGADER